MLPVCADVLNGLYGTGIAGHPAPRLMFERWSPAKKGNAMSDSATQAADTGAEPAVIRRATRADLEGIVALDARITGIAKPDYWNDLFERYATRRLEERFFLIADVGHGTGRIVGYMIGEVRAWEFGSEPCGWIFAFAVDPEMRLQGIGERLFKDITERIRATGIRTIRTMVSRDNRLVMAFFRSEGMSAGPYIQLEMELDT